MANQRRRWRQRQAKLEDAVLDRQALGRIRALHRPGGPNLLAKVLGLYSSSSLALDRCLAHRGDAERRGERQAGGACPEIQQRQRRRHGVCRAVQGSGTGCRRKAGSITPACWLTRCWRSIARCCRRSTRRTSPPDFWRLVEHRSALESRASDRATVRNTGSKVAARRINDESTFCRVAPGHRSAARCWCRPRCRPGRPARKSARRSPRQDAVQHALWRRRSRCNAPRR